MIALLVVVVATTAGWFWWPRPPQAWQDGSAHGDWIAVFDGEGSTTSDGSTIVLDPRPATSPEETHAGLVVSVTQYGDVDLSAAMHTVAQSRTGSDPNPWEVGWIVWHYDDHRRFYYFALKPNGWELGKVDPAYPGGQRFLATGATPTDAGAPQTVRVRQVGTTMDVWVDEAAVVTFTDAEEPYTRGSVGMYSEDARVEFTDVTARPATLP